MVDHISKKELKEMTLKKLQAHAKKLDKAGYLVPAFSGMSKDDLIKAIRASQKMGPVEESSEGESSTEEKAPRGGCNIPAGMDTKTKCDKGYKASEIKALAAECGIDYINKRQACGELVDMGVLPGDEDVPKSPRRKVRRKVRKSAKSSPAKRRKSAKSPPAGGKARYNELMKMTKVQLVELAKKYGVSHTGNKGPISERIVAHENIEGVGDKSPPQSPRRTPRRTPRRKSKRRVSPKKKPVVVESDSDSSSEEDADSSDDDVPEVPKEVPKSPRPCGSYNYEDLISKRLDELKGILRNKGIKADPDDVEQAADYICASENYGECDIVDNFNCPSGSMCEILDVDGGAGVCIPEESEVVARLVYDGKEIVGSAAAIKALRTKLGIKSSGEAKPLNSKKEKSRSKLVATAVQLSGKDADYFSGWHNGKLRMFLERYPIREDKRARVVLIAELAGLTGKSPSTYAGWSPDKLRKELEKVREQQSQKYEPADQDVNVTSREAAMKLTNEQLAKIILASGKTKFKSLKSLLKKKKKVELVDLVMEVSGIQEDDSSSAGESSSDDEDDDVVIEEVMEDPDVVIETVSESSDDDDTTVHPPVDEVDEVVVDDAESDSDMDDDDVADQGSVNVADVEQALNEVMDGKPGQIENITQVQNAVLKCLGLVA